MGEHFERLVGKCNVRNVTGLGRVYTSLAALTAFRLSILVPHKMDDWCQPLIAVLIEGWSHFSMHFKMYIQITVYIDITRLYTYNMSCDVFPCI